MTATLIITPELAVKEIEHECVMRELTYSKRVDEGSMSLSEAELKIAAMREAARIVRLYAKTKRNHGHDIRRDQR